MCDVLLLSDRNTEEDLDKILREMTLSPQFRKEHESIRRTAARFYTENRLGERKPERKRMRSAIVVTPKLVQPDVKPVKPFVRVNACELVHPEVEPYVPKCVEGNTCEISAEPVPVSKQSPSEPTNMLNALLSTKQKKRRGRSSSIRHNIARMKRLNTSFSNRI